jgi:hypothetical protein
MWESASRLDTMRRILLPSSVALIATLSAGYAFAGDRYGPPEPVKPVNVSAVEWNGPLLGWTNKPGADLGAVAPQVAKLAPSFTPAKAMQSSPPRAAAPVQTAALPTSIYAPSPSPAPAADTTVPTGYQPARPAGEVLTLSLADLPPPGPSLERQQAAEDDANVLAAQVARANALAAKDIAAGKPVTGGSATDLLGGP